MCRWERRPGDEQLSALWALRLGLDAVFHYLNDAVWDGDSFQLLPSPSAHFCGTWHYLMLTSGTSACGWLLPHPMQ